MDPSPGIPRSEAPRRLLPWGLRISLPAAVWLTLALAGMAVLAGYVSNAISRPVCERTVASWLVLTFTGGEPFYLLHCEQDPAARAAFAAVGAPYRAVPPGTDLPETWPHLEMKAHAWLPFFISVDYFWERQPEVGCGARKWYLGLFGWVVEIGETNHYAT